MPTALIAFGSNVGDSRKLFREVQAILAERTEQVDLIRASRAIETKPIGESLDDATEETDPSNEVSETSSAANKGVYLNAALLIQTELSAIQLIEQLLQVEKQLGRIRGRRWGPRTVDLDLLLYDDQIIEQSKLICPHPRMSFRRFVLEPAAEIAGKMIHPTANLTVGELLDRLNVRPNLLLWMGSSGLDQVRLLADRQTTLGQTLTVISPDQWPGVFNQRDTQESSQKSDDQKSDDQFWLCPVVQAEQFTALQYQAKLLILPTQEELAQPLADCASHFCGARLVVNLAQTDLEKELYGAIDATI